MSHTKKTHLQSRLKFIPGLGVSDGGRKIAYTYALSFEENIFDSWNCNLYRWMRVKWHMNKVMWPLWDGRHSTSSHLQCRVLLLHLKPKHLTLTFLTNMWDLNEALCSSKTKVQFKNLTETIYHAWFIANATFMNTGAYLQCCPKLTGKMFLC